MILGSTEHGVPHNLAAGELYARQIEVPDPGTHLAMIAALIDGQGPGAASGPATLYPALYDEAGALLGVGAGLVVNPDEDASWRALHLDVNGQSLQGTPWIGLRAMGADQAARIYGIDPGAATAVNVAASSGAPATLAGGTPTTLEAALYAEVFLPYVRPDVEEAALARLPWGLAQRFLTTGAISTSRRSATAGWYGPLTDSEQGANCIVRTDGPLADLVGERLQVSYRLGTLRRSVSVYVHDEDDFGPDAADEDLSLSRRAFMALAPLATDALPVEVAILA